MRTYLIQRMIGAFVTVLVVIFAVFMLIHLVPGDPVRIMLHESASAEAIEAYREQLGLNDALHIQFGRFLIELSKGDLGRTIRGNRPVLDEILLRYPFTLQLSAAALTFAVLVGVPAGVISGIRQNTFLDYFATTASLAGISMPSFWLGIILIQIFALHLDLLPTGRTGSVKHLILPAITLGSLSAATIARYTRSSLIEVLHLDYIRTARAKGLTEAHVIIVHALKNASLPVITVIGLSFGRLLAGAVITESIFSWPGIGRWTVDAILARDFPAVQGAVLFIAVAFVVVNLAVDLLYTYLDPRIRFR